jgi:hypothetical protein
MTPLSGLLGKASTTSANTGITVESLNGTATDSKVNVVYVHNKK